MEEIALGEMGLKVNYFYKLTPRQFSNAITGFRRKEENQSKEKWLMTRKIMYAALGPYLEKSAKETDVLKFPWDIETELSEAEELAAIAEAKKVDDFWKKIDEKRKIKKESLSK